MSNSTMHYNHEYQPSIQSCIFLQLERLHWKEYHHAVLDISFMAVVRVRRKCACSRQAQLLNMFGLAFLEYRVLFHLDEISLLFLDWIISLSGCDFSEFMTALTRVWRHSSHTQFFKLPFKFQNIKQIQFYNLIVFF